MNDDNHDFNEGDADACAQEKSAHQQCGHDDDDDDDDDDDGGGEWCSVNRPQ